MSFTCHCISALLLFLSLLSLVNAHGMMCFPRQRGAYKSSKCGDMSVPGIPSSEIVVDFCAHCLNGGTVRETKKHIPASGWKTYEPIKDFAGTADRAGICGDPKGNNNHMIGGVFMPYSRIPITANWKKGGLVDMSVEIDTNHNGYFEFRVCNMDTCPTNDISQTCFDRGHCVLLERVPHPDCQDPNVNTHTECGPIDSAYPSRWYVPCRKTAHVGVHIVGGSSGTMRYKLPNGFQCDHCIVQWYWATANSCAARGFMNYFSNYDNPFGTTCPSDGGGRGAHRPGMSECRGSAVPEEFWSCSDVSITADGDSPGPIRPVGSGGSGGGRGGGRARPTPSPTPSKTPRSSGGRGGRRARSTPSPTPSKTPRSSGGRGSSGSSGGGRSRGCIGNNKECDGSAECCGIKHLCVYTKQKSKFICREVSSLWKDLQAKKRSRSS